MKAAFLTFLFATLFSTPAFASYNPECADYLSLEDTEGEIGDYLPNWQAAAIQHTGGSLLLNSFEAEAWSDLIAGFSMILTFDDGKKGAFRHDRKSQEQLTAKLQKHRLVNVQFLPPSLSRLGEALRAMCKALERYDCAVYGRYQGLADTSERPFSPRQEQVLKWAYFGSVPGSHMIGAFRHIAAEKRTKVMNHYRETRTTTAINLVREVCTPADAERILDKVIHPMLDAAYDGFERQVAGARMN